MLTILCGSVTCFLVWLRLALVSSDFRQRVSNKWCATVGINNRKVVLYANDWTDESHYICQYDSEFSSVHDGAGQLLLPRRLRPQSGPISHPLKYQVLIGTFVIF